MGYACLRFCVFFFNILFFLSGVALCGYGIYLRVDEDDYSDICEQYSWVSAANLCIAAGALIFFIAAFGCIGAAMKSSALLGFFFFFLLLIFVLELAAGVTAFVYRTEVVDEAEICLNGTIRQARDGKGTYQDAWKNVQKEFDCCGVRGHADWEGFADHNCEDTKNDGCLDKFEDKSTEFLLIIGALCIGLTLIEILGMILSISLILKINKEKKKYSPEPKEDYGKF
ncbi:tetraspanin-9-like [Dendronephthya gigantea]|uniref:tetraspanin-9-like n=1 Tax=Dendronephthya gigantea TaxID=151771 RepID=UPI00106B9EF5|nr:tetraspanin-9-like [Dendronephthya gigantea]